MSFFKILTGLNWALISLVGAFVLWYILQKSNPYNDAGGGEMETAIKGLSIFLVLVLIGLNFLPYSWTKIIAFVLVVLFLLSIRYIATH